MVADPARPPGEARSVLGRIARRPLSVAGAAIVAASLLVAVAGAALAPYGYDESVLSDRDQGPSLAHPMGTDLIGRDMLSRVVFGFQTSARVALVAATIATAAGVAVGTWAAYRRGWLDELLGRLTDLALCIPILPVLLLVANRIEGGGARWLWVSVLIGGVAWPAAARLMRNASAPVVASDYVIWAHAAGAPTTRVVGRHVLPNTVGAIATVFTLAFAFAVLAEATVAFLGFGGDVPSLGKLVAEARVASRTRPWLFYFPGGALVVLTLGVGLAGDGLRDALSPAGDDPMPRT